MATCSNIEHRFPPLLPGETKYLSVVQPEPEKAPKLVVLTDESAFSDSRPVAVRLTDFEIVLVAFDPRFPTIRIPILAIESLEKTKVQVKRGRVTVDEDGLIMQTKAATVVCLAWPPPMSVQFMHIYYKLLPECTPRTFAFTYGRAVRAAAAATVNSAVASSGVSDKASAAVADAVYAASARDCPDGTGSGFRWTSPTSQGPGVVARDMEAAPSSPRTQSPVDPIASTVCNSAVPTTSSNSTNENLNTSVHPPAAPTDRGASFWSSSLPLVLATTALGTTVAVPDGWRMYCPHREFHRQLSRMPPNERGRWRLSTLNLAAKIPTYPAVMMVPSSVSDADIVRAACFRSRERVAVATFLSIPGGVLARCSQPLPGVPGLVSRGFSQGNRRDGKADEALLLALARQSNSLPGSSGTAGGMLRFVTTPAAPTEGGVDGSSGSQRVAGTEPPPSGGPSQPGASGGAHSASAGKGLASEDTSGGLSDGVTGPVPPAGAPAVVGVSAADVDVMKRQQRGRHLDILATVLGRAAGRREPGSAVGVGPDEGSSGTASDSGWAQRRVSPPRPADVATTSGPSSESVHGDGGRSKHDHVSTRTTAAAGSSHPGVDRKNSSAAARGSQLPPSLITGGVGFGPPPSLSAGAPGFGKSAEDRSDEPPSLNPFASSGAGRDRQSGGGVASSPAPPQAHPPPSIFGGPGMGTYGPTGATAQGISEDESTVEVIVVDARSQVVANLNRSKGGGYEAGYRKTGCCFMDLPNIHAVSDAWSKLRKAAAAVNNDASCHTRRPQLNISHLPRETAPDGNNVFSQPPMPNSGYHDAIARSGWLPLLQRLVWAGVKVADLLGDGRAVVVHCTDGWDRTSQLTALASLFLDPYYRTIEGFAVLVEKEWLAFGHKFAERCGHRLHRTTAQASADDAAEKSRGASGALAVNLGPSDQVAPIFLQWVDAVRVVVEQCPEAFEFTSELLVVIVEELYSGKHGTFLVDSDLLRAALRIPQSTVSLWTDLFALVAEERIHTSVAAVYMLPHPRLVNPFFQPPSAGGPYIIRPSSNAPLVTPWHGLLFRYGAEIGGSMGTFGAGGSMFGGDCGPVGSGTHPFCAATYRTAYTSPTPAWSPGPWMSPSLAVAIQASPGLGGASPALWQWVASHPPSDPRTQAWLAAFGSARDMGAASSGGFDLSSLAPAVTGSCGQNGASRTMTAGSGTGHVGSDLAAHVSTGGVPSAWLAGVYGLNVPRTSPLVAGLPTDNVSGATPDADHPATANAGSADRDGAATAVAASGGNQLPREFDSTSSAPALLQYTEYVSACMAMGHIPDPVVVMSILGRGTHPPIPPGTQKSANLSDETSKTASAVNVVVPLASDGPDAAAAAAAMVTASSCGWVRGSLSEAHEVLKPVTTVETRTPPQTATASGRVGRRPGGPMNPAPSSPVGCSTGEQPHVPSSPRPQPDTGSAPTSGTPDQTSVTASFTPSILPCTAPAAVSAAVSVARMCVASAALGVSVPRGLHLPCIGVSADGFDPDVVAAAAAAAAADGTTAGRVLAALANHGWSSVMRTPHGVPICRPRSPYSVPEGLQPAVAMAFAGRTRGLPAAVVAGPPHLPPFPFRRRPQISAAVSSSPSSGGLVKRVAPSKHTARLAAPHSGPTGGTPLGDGAVVITSGVNPETPVVLAQEPDVGTTDATARASARLVVSRRHGSHVVVKREASAAARTPEQPSGVRVPLCVDEDDDDDASAFSGSADPAAPRTDISPSRVDAVVVSSSTNSACASSPAHSTPCVSTMVPSATSTRELVSAVSAATTVAAAAAAASAAALAPELSVCGADATCTLCVPPPHDATAVNVAAAAAAGAIRFAFAESAVGTFPSDNVEDGDGTVGTGGASVGGVGGSVSGTAGGKGAAVFAQKATACRRCNATFSWLKRKHYCKLCQQAFCDNCSSHRRQDGEVVRVCVLCYGMS
eukprot:TRINITY_DN6241_c0_g1_i1.p1 TRINITY_DN6241_c0_g1~~TRINITY_DN6241_c0_g1_i1.p1  ORF type:complete len:1944 (-),score=155.89 TRINITY_DN6241_c0_g1_i1:2517-8348(-)